MWVYLNNRFVRNEDALVSVFDHGFLYGDGVFETLRSYGPRLFMPNEHLARLYRSAEAIGLTIPLSREHWTNILSEGMTRNGVGTNQQDAYLRITISRGIGEIGLDPALCRTPTVVVMVKPLIAPSPNLYETGVRIIIASTKRNLPGALSPQIKATNFLNNIQAKREALAAGVFDSVLLNWEGHVTEGTVSNLFFVTNGCLRTPALDCGLLNGITRMLVLRLARELGLPVEEGHYETVDLQQAEECFLTNTSLEIMPVTSIGNRSVGNGTPGPMTVRLRKGFIERRDWFCDQPPCE